MNYKVNSYSKNEDILIIEILDTEIEDSNSIKEMFKPYLDSYKFSIIVDLQTINYISPEVIGLFLEYNRVFNKHDVVLILKGLKDELMHNFNELKITNSFFIASDLDSAIAKINWEKNVASEKFKINISPSLKFVPSVRNFVNNVLLTKGYSSSDAYRMQSIVDELLTNAIEHGDWSDDKNEARLSFLVNKSKAEAFVHNLSTKKEIEQIDQAFKKSGSIVDNFDSIRGRGISIVKMLANKLSLKITDNRTIIRVTKEKSKKENKRSKR